MFFNFKIKMPKEKFTIIDGIELGLNILAQDLIWKSHTEKNIQNYINRFKFYREEKPKNG